MIMQNKIKTIKIHCSYTTLPEPGSIAAVFAFAVECFSRIEAGDAGICGRSTAFAATHASLLLDLMEVEERDDGDGFDTVLPDDWFELAAAFMTKVLWPGSLPAEAN